jgi:hypothetical protein
VSGNAGWEAPRISSASPSGVVSFMDISWIGQDSHSTHRNLSP